MSEAAASLRIDRWLWYARLFKTRSLAGKVVSDHGARVTRHGQTQRVDKASFGVRPGDTIAITKGQRILVVEVVELGTRRGPAPEAQALYTDHSPPPPPKEERLPTPFEREPGAGRPTKKDRRALDAARIPFDDE